MRTSTVPPTASPILVLLGRQGAGKGTQAVRLARHLQAVHLSTGDLLRQAVAADSPMGRAVAPVLARGELVSDDLMLSVVLERLAELSTARKGMILDGFPRTALQADAFVRAIGVSTIDAALEIDVPVAVVRDRLASRRVCGACSTVTTAPPAIEAVACGQCGNVARRRADDTAAAIDRRLSVYEEQATPLRKFFADRGLLVSVDGLGSPETVFERAVKALRPMLWGEGMAVG